MYVSISAWFSMNIIIVDSASTALIYLLEDYWELLIFGIEIS